MSVSEHDLLDGDVRFIEILVGPLKRLFVKYLGFVIILVALIEIPLRVVHCPVVRICLLKGRYNLNRFL